MGVGFEETFTAFALNNIKEDENGQPCRPTPFSNTFVGDSLWKKTPSALSSIGRETHLDPMTRYHSVPL